MFFYKGLSCPHCSKPFDESDDIVACPVCGAPHHRDCWKDRGGCACADAHGTDAQWSRETALHSSEPSSSETAAQTDMVACPRCGTDNSPFAERCSYCGMPLKAQEWGTASPPPFQEQQTAFHEYTPFHTHQMYCGGVSPDAELEGESAKDLATVVRSNVPYYLPRFEHMAKTDSKLSWNWAAFLLFPYWLLFRKQYLAGIVVLTVDIFYTIITNLLALSCFSSAFDKTSYDAMAAELLYLMQTSERAAIAMYIISLLSLTLLCMRLFVALFGNRLYMKHCLHVINKARRYYPEGYHAQLTMVGGTSAVLALVGYMCSSLLPNFLLTLIT